MTLLLSSSREEVSWKSFEANQTNTRVPILFRSVKILLTKTILLWNRRRFCFATFLFLVYSFLKKKITSYSSITVKTGCFLYGKKKGIWLVLVSQPPSVECLFWSARIVKNSHPHAHPHEDAGNFPVLLLHFSEPLIVESRPDPWVTALTGPSHIHIYLL